MANNYKVKMVDLQNKYKFKIFCSSQMYDDTELKRQLDTIYKAFPKASATGTSASLDGTAAALMNIGLKGNGSQTGTPTPATPIPVNVVTGDNTINICGKNLFNKSTITTSAYLKEDGTLQIGTGAEYVTSDFIPVQPNTTYYKTQTLSPRTKFYDANKQVLNNTTYQDVSIGGNAGSFTTPNNAYYFRFTGNVNTSTGININSVMVHKGPTASTYEPYIGASYPINLGVKNLFDKSTANLNKGVATANGGLYNSDINFSTDYIEVKTNGTYYTASGVSSVANRVYGAQYDSNKQYVGAISTNVGQKTFYISNANVKYIRLTGLLEEIDTYQIEEGSKTNSYNPYGTTPIELCKIGDYQDYIYKENKKWYKYKAIDKVVLDGTQNIPLASGTPRRFNATYTALGIDNVKSGSTALETQNNYRMCDHFAYTSGVNTWGMYYLHNNWLVMLDGESVIASANDLKNWLASNPTTIYYVLAEPTTEEITDATLISQLEALRNAESYEGQTNISQVNNDLPFIITASAIKDLSNL